MQIEEVDINKTCCLNCKWFEERTCFCRKNPPQVVIQYANRMAFPSSIFPKITVPVIDWCSEFKNKYQKLLV